MSSETSEQLPDKPFLVTANELKDRRTKRRLQRLDKPSRSEAIRWLVELGLKAKK
jgi:hypothetical protein